MVKNIYLMNDSTVDTLLKILKAADPIITAIYSKIWNMKFQRVLFHHLNRITYHETGKNEPVWYRSVLYQRICQEARKNKLVVVLYLTTSESKYFLTRG